MCSTRVLELRRMREIYIILGRSLPVPVHTVYSRDSTVVTVTVLRLYDTYRYRTTAVRAAIYDTVTVAPGPAVGLFACDSTSASVFDLASH